MAAPYPSFPASPTIGQTYTDANGAVWTFGNIGWTKTLVSLTSDPSIWQDIDSALSYDSSGNVTITGGLTAGGKVSIPLGTAPLPSLYFGTDTNTGIYSPGADQVGIATNGTSRLVVDASGNVNIDSGTFYVDAVNNRVGVGTTSPNSFTTNNLVIEAANTAGLTISESTGAGSASIVFAATSAFQNKAKISSNTSTATLEFSTSGSKKMHLDASGNLGLGVVPSAWNASSKVFQVSQAAIESRSNGVVLANNGYYNSSGSWIYQNTDTAGLYNIDGNAHAWFRSTNTPSAGAAITFTQAMTLDASGRLGIGTTSPNSLLEVAGITTINASAAGANSQLNFKSGGAGASGFQIGQGLNSQHLFVYDAAAAAERIRLDSSGRLLVGTTTNTNNVRIGQKIASVATGGTDYGGVSLTTYAGTTNAVRPVLDFQRSKGTTDGSLTLVASSDYLGTIAFRGSDGSAFADSAYIDAIVEGTPAAGKIASRLVFSTTADGEASPTPRMRIGNGGNVGIGQADLAGIRLGVTSSGQDYAGYFIYPAAKQGVGINSSGAGNSYAMFFFNDSIAVGSVYTTSSSTAYNTSSDYRLKENVTAVTDGITRLQQLKPSRFNFIADPGKTVDGFIAHEVQTVVPEAITGEKDAVDADGNPVYQGIDQSKLVPLLTAALQEAVARIEQLETAVAALQGS